MIELETLIKYVTRKASIQKNFEWVVVAVVCCISKVRLQIPYQWHMNGIPLAEVARHLVVSVSAISKAITRRTKDLVKLVNYVPCRKRQRSILTV